MSPKSNFVRLRQILRDFYSARCDNYAFIFAMAALTIIVAGCTAVYYSQAQQRDSYAAPPKHLPKSATVTNSPLQTKAFQSFPPADENTGNSAINSSGSESRVATDGLAVLPCAITCRT
jgi:hypothetical protein